VKNRGRAREYSILEPLRTNVSCAPSYMNVHDYFLLLDRGLKVVIFTRNVPAAQTGTPPPPATITTTIEPVFCV
jgi:hypothetical protein